MRRWSPRRPAVYFTRGFQRRSVDATERRRRKGELLVLLVFLKGRERDIVGRVTLSNVVRGAFHAASVGYSLAEPHRGRGLMHEALRAVLDYAFGPMGLHRVTAAWMPSNRPSGRVLRRLGFRRDGLARKYLLIDGKWEDHVLTSLVNTKWRPPKDDAVAVASAPRGGVRGGSRRRRPRGR
jgi:ribosomal-protein-alanine N-acetyltransferase